mgnify:CR=1 FL=1
MLKNLLIIFILIGIIAFGKSMLSNNKATDQIDTTDGSKASGIDSTATNLTLKVATSTIKSSVKPQSKSTALPKLGPKLSYTTVSQAVVSGVAMQCNYTTKQISTTLYIHNANIRKEQVTSSQTIYLVSTPNAIFSWNKGVSIENDFVFQAAAAERNKLNTMSLVNFNCYASTVPSSYFARP